MGFNQKALIKMSPNPNSELQIASAKGLRIDIDRVVRRKVASSTLSTVTSLTRHLPPFFHQNSNRSVYLSQALAFRKS